MPPLSFAQADLDCPGWVHDRGCFDNLPSPPESTSTIPEQSKSPIANNLTLDPLIQGLSHQPFVLVDIDLAGLRSESPSSKNDNLYGPEDLFQESGLEVPSVDWSDLHNVDSGNSTNIHSIRIDPLSSLPDSTGLLLSSLETYIRFHPHWLVQLWCLIILVLNLRFHLGTCASNLLLSFGKAISIFLGLILPKDSMPITLDTVYKQFGVKDLFDIHPICMACGEIYPTTSAVLNCECSKDLYHKQEDKLVWPSWISRPTTQTTARLEARKSIPIHPLLDQLPLFLNQAGVEESSEKWLSYQRNATVMRDIMDGRVWKSLKSHNNSPFFATGLSSNELQLGFTLSINW